MSTNTNLDQKKFTSGFFGPVDDVIEDGRVAAPFRDRTAANEEEEAQEINPSPVRITGKMQQENKFLGKLYIVQEAKEVTLEELAELLQKQPDMLVIHGDIVKPKLKVSF